MSSQSYEDDFDRYVQWHHGARASDFEPTDVPGYWRRRQPCAGRMGGCREPLHSCLGNEDPIRHTVQFLDSPRDARGRWVSRYRTWAAHRVRCAS
jgi:hypothetical protein